MIELSLIFLLALWIALWIGCGWAASAIMAGKGRDAGAGWALGLILGIFGVLIAAVLPPGDRPRAVRVYHPSTGEVSVEVVPPVLGTCRECGATLSNPTGCWRCKAPVVAPRLCPFCTGEVPAAAQKCRHCGEWLVPEAERTAI